MKVLFLEAAVGGEVVSDGGASLSLGWPCCWLGGGAVVPNRKPIKTEKASCFVGDGSGGEKGKLGTKL